MRFDIDGVLFGNETFFPSPILEFADGDVRVCMLVDDNFGDDAWVYKRKDDCDNSLDNIDRDGDDFKSGSSLSNGDEKVYEHG